MARRKDVGKSHQNDSFAWLHLSQGLFLPLTSFPPSLCDQLLIQIGEGGDETSLLGVTKRADESQDELASDESEKAKRFCFGVYNHPPKTDEPRVQNSASSLAALDGHAYRASLKIDGTSATYALQQDSPHNLSVNSRNFSVSFDDNSSVYARIAKSLDIHKRLLQLYLESRKSETEYPRYAIQGEIYGMGIQKDLLQLKNRVDFAVFSVWDAIDSRYLNSIEATDIVNRLGLKEVPILLEGNSFDSKKFNVGQLLELARGNYDGTSNAREGYVLRSTRNDCAPSADAPQGRVSIKVINNDYLEHKDGKGATKRKSTAKAEKE